MKIAWITLRFFIAGIALVSVFTNRVHAAEPGAIDEDDDGHYERLPMEPANVKRVFLGFRLTTVDPNSIYAKAGLRSGDLLKSMNGKAVVEQDDLKELPKILDRDKKVEIKIEREGKRITLRYSVKTVTRVVPAKKVAAKKAQPKTLAKAKVLSAKRAASSASGKKAPKKATPPGKKKKTKLRTAEQDTPAPEAKTFSYVWKTGEF